MAADKKHDATDALVSTARKEAAALAAQTGAASMADTDLIERLCAILQTDRERLEEKVRTAAWKAGRVPDPPASGYRPDGPLYEGTIGDCPEHLRPLHDPTGEPVTITADQHDAIWRAYNIWTTVYRHEKGVYPDVTNTANLSKSCLLGRLLLQGRPPLPEAPPVVMSAPAYHLRDPDLCPGCGRPWDAPGATMMVSVDQALALSLLRDFPDTGRERPRMVVQVVCADPRHLR